MIWSRKALLCFESIARCLPVNRSRLRSLRPSRFAISRGCASRTTSHLKNISMSISTSQSPVANPELIDQSEEVELLPAVSDYYGGVVVEIKAPMDSSAFASSLRASISNWRKQGTKGVWIKLPINLANLVQPAVEEGFWYHHAEPSYLMLVYWIPDSKHTIPANASHRVGVGGFVLNDKREVLVVQENSGRLRGLGVWKIPTGVVDQGEDIYAAAIREVKEETGIDTEFVEILAFRHATILSRARKYHHCLLGTSTDELIYLDALMNIMQSHMSFFEKSDLFFACMLRPLSFDIQKQESEIEAAQWMPIEEFAAQPFVQKYDMLKYIIDVSLAKVERSKDLSQPSRPGNMSESN